MSLKKKQSIRTQAIIRGSWITERKRKSCPRIGSASLRQTAETSARAQTSFGRRRVLRHFPKKNQLTRGLHFRYTFLFLLWLETPTHARASRLLPARPSKARGNPNSRAGFTYQSAAFRKNGRKPQLTRGLHHSAEPAAFFPQETPTHTRASPNPGALAEPRNRNPNSHAGFTPVYCIFTLCNTQYIGAVPFFRTRTRLKGASRLKRRLPAEAGLTSPNLRDRVRPLYLSDKETISESKQKMQNYAKIFRI